VLQLVATQGMLDSGDAEDARTRLIATERTARETLAEMRRLLALDEDDAALAPHPAWVISNDSSPRSAKQECRLT
jgi:hypothetical protein